MKTKKENIINENKRDKSVINNNLAYHIKQKKIEAVF